jgi:Txe/YoeB family toxin of Txe-Axe toxin-antitoxin module
MSARVVFAEEKLRKAFRKLKNSRTEDKKLYEWLNRAFDDLQNDPFCGIQIQIRLTPKKYIRKYSIDNLWKYNLPNAWRLVYSVARHEIVIVSIIIEWMDHKNYERRFGYG